MKISKTQIAYNHYVAGEYKRALSILSTFKQYLTTEEKRVLKIAHECESGNSSFYQQIGEDVESIKSTARQIVQEYFAKHC